MRKKQFLLFVSVLAIVFLPLRNFAGTAPDEGMWLPMFLKDYNYQEMKRLGLKLTPEQLYNVNNSSLKDAIVNFGNFCTAEVVSAEGLLFTNHHCGYGSVQKLSSVQNDYLKNGFWAYEKSQELACEGLTATFLIRMEDVTEQVLGKITDTTSEKSRSQFIKKAIDELVKTNSEKGRYKVEVKRFFDGNAYYMFVSEVYTDIRLVGTPPSSIGKYGGDTDNWMWPRHTGDFSIFRIYTAPDGKPAPYSKDNIPYKSKRFLSISIKGVKKNDYAMIWGYPGSTERYMTSYELKNTFEQQNATIIAAGKKIFPVMKEQMDADAQTRIGYAATYAQAMNMWKNKIGENKGLQRLDVMSQKQALEKELTDWINKDAARQQKYGNVLKNIETACNSIAASNSEKALWYFQISVMGYPTAMAIFQTHFGMTSILENNKKATSQDLAKFTATAEEAYKDLNVNTEKKLLEAVLKMYAGLAKEYQPAIFEDVINKKYKGDIHQFVEEAYKKSIYASIDNFKKFTQKPNKKALDNDMLAQVVVSLYKSYQSFASQSSDAENQLRTARRGFLAALQEMKPNQHFYPDANFTLRTTYGTVLDYQAADAVHYNYVTTLKGVMEKEDSENDEFYVEPKLKELYKKKDFGPYAENGDIVVCFLTTNDITGGNSGSPVINGNGELIGLAFDGNWEAMSGDIAFEPELQRTICVDARYVLFVIDKFAGAQNIINELTIVK